MKGHITGGHENIRCMTHGMKKSIRMDKTNKTLRAHMMKEHITSGHDNIKHMSHQMGDRNPNDGQDIIKHRTCRIK